MIDETPVGSINVQGYKNTLKNGKPIYIRNWPVNVQFANLAHACDLWGNDEMVAIAKLDMKAAMRAAMNTKQPTKSADMMAQFVSTVALDGVSISQDKINTMFESNMGQVLEIFAHVIHSQYNDFFDLGLAGEPSQAK